MSLTGKVVVVVGASGGIGQALVAKLASLETKLVLVGRNHTKLEHFAATLPSQTPVLLRPTDITNYGEVQALMAGIKAEYGRIDILVNAAGAGILKPYNKIEPADLDAMLDLNLKGSFYTSQLAAEVMKENRSGHICQVVGILGKHSMAMGTAYCASKFGLVGVSRCMADELKRFGVKITLFYFGGIDTPFWDQVSLKVDRSKMLSPDTAANSILFALQAEPQAVPLEINIQPESHLFF